jgi:hypothetical protein
VRAVTVKLGDTKIARIGLGTNRLSDTPEHVTFVREAVAAGINLVDTAHLYVGGESERVIGEALDPVPEGCVVADTTPGKAAPTSCGDRSRRACGGCARTPSPCTTCIASIRRRRWSRASRSSPPTTNAA